MPKRAAKPFESNLQYLTVTIEYLTALAWKKIVLEAIRHSELNGRSGFVNGTEPNGWVPHPEIARLRAQRQRFWRREDKKKLLDERTRKTLLGGNPHHNSRPLRVLRSRR